MNVRWNSLSVASLCFAMLPASAAAFPTAPQGSCPGVSLDPIPLGNAEGVTFRPGEGDLVNRDSIPFNRAYTYQTRDGAYSLFLDPTSVAPLPIVNSFSFQMTLRANNPAAPACTFTVGEDPVGKFADFLADVTVKIAGSSSAPSIATVRVPVHSAGYEDALELLADPNSRFVIVHLSDSSPPGILVKNQLSSFPIHITGLTAGPGCVRCWMPASTPFTPVTIAPGSEARVPLNVQPRMLGAVFATAFILGKDSPHDTLLVNLTYNVDAGGAVTQKQMTVPVRFNPSFWELILAVLMGALFGTLLRLWFDSAHNRLTVKLALQCLGMAAIAEFICAVAASFDSRVVILGFDMDPRQFIPALIISTLAAGGPIVAKYLGKLAGGSVSDAAPAPPLVPAGGGGRSADGGD